ncbi:MAG: DUF1365 domain-containing protein [Burkholderiales bacterium]
MTHSALYVGTVRHRRFAVRRHELLHRISMAYLDLDELPQLLGGRLVRRSPGLVRFRRADYLGDPAVPLADSVRELVGEAARVRLLTNLRTLGHCFNPVSFYYCFDDGERLRSVVAEVTNTPWGERHAYVLSARGEQPLRFRFSKAFHVSPFMPMDIQHDWRFSVPGKTLGVHMDDRQSGDKIFDATLVFERRALNGATLAWALLRFPAMSLQVVVGIYWQALRLWLKRTPVHDHPHLLRGPQ